MNAEWEVQKAIFAKLTEEVTVSYPGVTNSMPSPFDPSGWTGVTDSDGTLNNEQLVNPSGEDFVHVRLIGGKHHGYVNGGFLSDGNIKFHPPK